MDKNRLFASLEKKLSQSVGHRVDIQYTDSRRINKSTAHFMVAFTGNNPTSEEISEFFIRQYGAKVVPYISTARVYDKEKVVTVVASILNVTREFEDIKRHQMATVIEGSVYLDVPLQETWEVEERAGKKVLVRKAKEDIMAIVQARRNAMMDTQSQHKTFASLAVGSSLLRYLGILEKGDHVKVYLDEKIVEAEVLAVSEAEAKIKHSSGIATVPRQAVVEIVSRSADREEKQKKATEEYFSKAYGDKKYAQKLTS
jgi:hypothetical protein